MKRTTELLVLVNREALKLMAQKTDKANKKYNALRASYMNQLKYKQYIKRNIRTKHK